MQSESGIYCEILARVFIFLSSLAAGFPNRWERFKTFDNKEKRLQNHAVHPHKNTLMHALKQSEKMRDQDTMANADKFGL